MVLGRVIGMPNIEHGIALINDALAKGVKRVCGVAEAIARAMRAFLCGVSPAMADGVHGLVFSGCEPLCPAPARWWGAC